ncbi:MAG: TonB-dependent receptor [Colwellia sp.]|nr:TonB-dependent receptor [Colwellia sp.]
MKALRPRKNKITIAISTALIPVMMTASAYAAEPEALSNAQKAKKKQEEIEIIEVTSYRDSIASSLNVKRNANAVIDAITADDIGSFPDDNIAESLQRISGISITRSFSGEGESVSIRGFAPGQNLSLVNGQQLTSSAFNFNNALGRGYNYGVLPSTIIKTTEVHKSSQAYFPEGGVGGTVNVLTRKPLAQRKELLFVTSGSLGHNTLADSLDPKLSGLASWKLSDKFGALISLDYSDKDTRRDSETFLNYKKQTFTTQDGTQFNNVLVPGSNGTAQFNQTLKRKTAMVTLQYQPIDSIDMSFNYLRSDVEGHNLNTALFSLNHQFKHNAAGTVVSATRSADDPDTIATIEYAARANGRTAQVTSSFRDTELLNESFNYDIKWLGDNLTLKAALGASESSGGPGDVNAISLSVAGRSIVGLDDGIGYVKLPDADLTDMSDAKIWSYGGGAIFSENDNSFLSLDGEYYFDDSLITSVQFGARFTKASQSNRHFIKGSDLHLKTDAHEKLRGVLNASDLGELVSTPSDFHSGLNDQAPSAFQYLDPNTLRLDDYGIIETKRAHQGTSFLLEEETSAYYLQANFEHEFDDVLMRGNFGVRYVDQETDTFNFTNTLKWGVAEDLALINNFTYDSHGTGGDDYILPSANVSFDLPHDFVVRAAFSTVITRPAFSQLAQQNTANEDAKENAALVAKRGNADLKAFEANKYDLSTEWYYKEGSSISLGLFHYDIKTYVTSETVEEDIFNDGRIWTVTQPINEDGGELSGIEAAISHQFTSLPAPFDGLGAQLNYTYIDSETNAVNPLDDKELPLPGLSETTYNAVLFYSKEKLDARIAYNYRKDYYEQLFAGFPRFSGDIARLTAKVKYRLDNGLSVYVQGNNLTDEQDFRYLGEEFRPVRTSEGGRSFAVGFNYIF